MRYPASELNPKSQNQEQKDPEEGQIIVYTLWRRGNILGASADYKFYSSMSRKDLLKCQREEERYPNDHLP
jgi:hypothetical protein